MSRSSSPPHSKAISFVEEDIKEEKESKQDFLTINIKTSAPQGIGNLPDGFGIAMSSGCLTLQDAAMLVGTNNKALHKFFRPSLEEPLRLLHQAVIYGEKSKVLAILEKSPALLLHEGPVVTGYCGNSFQGTALRLALGAGDSDMVKAIVPYLDQIDPNEKFKQYEAQFNLTPEEKAAEDALIAEDLHALETVIQAIANASNDQFSPPIMGANDQVIKEGGKPIGDLRKAVNQFHEYLDLKPSRRGVIKKGKHFHEQSLLRAFKLYDEKYDAFGGHYDSPKNKLAWRQIGYAERSVPACDAQALCQGIYNIVEGGEALRRSLEFRYGGGRFYPLDSVPTGRLGYDCAGPPWVGWRVPVGGVGGGAALEKLYRTKASELQAIMRRPTTESVRKCAIM